MALAKRAAVLVVEDQSIVAGDLQQTLADLGYDAFAIAASAEEALARSAEKRPDIALVDIRIRGRLDGIKTAQHLQERFGVPIVYLTAHADGAAVRGQADGAVRLLLKPVKPMELKERGSLFNRLGTAGPRPRRLPRLSRARAGRRRSVSGPCGVERILSSADFDASRQDFPNFIEGLAGRADDLTQSRSPPASSAGRTTRRWWLSCASRPDGCGARSNITCSSGSSVSCGSSCPGTSSAFRPRPRTSPQTGRPAPGRRRLWLRPTVAHGRDQAVRPRARTGAQIGGA